MIRVFLGDALSVPSERRFLERVRKDLGDLKVPALILANFIAGRAQRQVDFLIATATRTVHCELKSYRYPVVGGLNGPWMKQLPDGTITSLLQQNPFQQALSTTFAIGDDLDRQWRQHSPKGSKAPSFPRCIDTVICFFPSIPPGSRIPRRDHVATVGYRELLNRLRVDGPRVPWSDTDWEAFIREIGLYCEEDDGPERRTSGERRQLVQGYRRRFASHVQVGLHELVPLTITVDHDHRLETDLAHAALEQPAVLVTGASGAGKTHTARHAALMLAKQGHVPIWVRCADYERGRFDAAMGRAVAPYTTATWRDLSESAPEVGGDVVVFLDGLNECSPQMCSALLEDAASLALSNDGVRVVITTQDPVSLSEPLHQARMLRVEAPDANQRTLLARSYGNERGAGDDLEAFTTPLELSVAAECAMNLPPMATRADLLDMYVRKRTPNEVTRTALRSVAALMAREMCRSLPVRRVVQYLERARGGVGPEVVDAVMRSSLVVSGQGRFAFTHERIERFLAAADLVHQSRSGKLVGRHLRDPRYLDLSEDVIALETDPSRVRDALREAAAATTLALALRGALGEVAHQVTTAEAAELLADATYATNPDSLRLETPLSVATGSWRMVKPWTEFQRAVLAAIGRTLPHGVLAEEVGTLLDRTDHVIAEASRRRDALFRQVFQPYVDFWHGEDLRLADTIYAGYGAGSVESFDRPAAAYVCTELRSQRYVWPRPTQPSADAAPASLIAAQLPSPSWGRLYAALWCINPRNGKDAALVPVLVNRAWECGDDELKTFAVDRVGEIADDLDETAAATLRALLKALPISVRSDDSVVRVRRVLRDPDAAITSEQLKATVETILRLRAHYGDARPIAGLESWRAISLTTDELDYFLAVVKAFGIILAVFGERESGGPYTQVVSGLTSAERCDLWFMATSLTEEGLAVPYFVLRAIPTSATPGEIELERVVIRTASALPRHQASVVRASMIANHLGALAMCRAFAQVPPALGSRDGQGADIEAWRTVRLLAWQMREGDVESATVNDLVGRMTGELAAAAVDVMHWLDAAAEGETDEDLLVHERLLQHHTSQLRELLEWGLRNRDKLTTYFGDDEHSARDLYIVRMLGEIGDDGSANLLRALLMDPELGRAAVASIRRISARASVVWK